jgi:hypothetical protein
VLPLFPARGLSFSIGAHSTRRGLSSLPRTSVAGLLADDPAAASEIMCNLGIYVDCSETSISEAIGRVEAGAVDFNTLGGKLRAKASPN